MGVFAVIGVVIILAGLASENGKLALVGAIVAGIGIAGNTNGY